MTWTQENGHLPLLSTSSSHLVERKKQPYPSEGPNVRQMIGLIFGKYIRLGVLTAKVTPSTLGQERLSFTTIKVLNFWSL